jgi:hypothetical protein
MCVFATRFISFLALLGALVAHTALAVGQDAFGDSGTKERKSRIWPSLRFENHMETRPGMAHGGLAMLSNGGSPELVGETRFLAPMPLRENRNPNTAAISSPAAWAGGEAATAQPTAFPEQTPATDAKPGVHLPGLREVTIANILRDLRNEFGPQSLNRPGNFHWFFEPQRSLATGDKSYHLVACNKMFRQSNICASTDAKSINVSFRAFEI